MGMSRARVIGDLHNLVHVPEHSVGMVILGGVEPEVYAMFSLTLAACEYIGLKNVRLPRLVAQEFEVYLIVLRSLRRKLPEPKNKCRYISRQKQTYKEKPQILL
jgi:hypothetical protein